MRPALSLTLLLASHALGAIYENALEIDDEEDILELQQNGDISDETADTLLELFREGADLNSADRDRLYDLPGLTYEDVDAIIEYRTAKGHIDEPTELVEAGAITAEQLIQIAPFIRIDAAKPILPVSGRLRLQTRASNGDFAPGRVAVAPPVFFNARLKLPENLSTGISLFTTRTRTNSDELWGRPGYNADYNALEVKMHQYSVNVPRLFAMWSPGKAKLVVGTYTIGFGERLTLDTTRRITPKGIYLTDDFRRPPELSTSCRLTGIDSTAEETALCTPTEDGQTRNITADYTWREVFQGVAGQIEDLHLGGEVKLSMYGFASYQQRSLYQYQLYNKVTCEDPNSTEDACSAPPVMTTTSNGEVYRIKTSTLNNLFDEVAGGGHVSLKPISRLTIGITGFGALPIFQQNFAAPELLQLDFQEWSRYPAGGAFGAIGANAHLTIPKWNFYIEAARSFDRRPWRLQGRSVGGGFGVEQRSTYNPVRGHEFELSLRFYDPDFGTPYARPISAPDQTDGLRARNEAGARLRWLGRFGRDWEARVRADFWVNPFDQESSPGVVSLPAGVPNLYLIARLDFTGWKFLQPAVWLDMRNRNLLSDVRGACSPGTFVFQDDGTPVACGGDLYRIAARVVVSPFRKYFRATVQGYVIWRDDISANYSDRFRNDFQMWLDMTSQPIDWLQLRWRTRYLNQSWDDPTHLEESLWSYFEAAWLFTRGARLALRYDLYYLLDQRGNTLNRFPNPEHRFQLDVRYSF